MENVTKTPLLNGINKYAGRPLMSDLIAGIDPTGTKTLKYGIQDADIPQNRSNLRKTLGVTGGLLAGALLVPSAIYGLIKGGKGLIRNKGILKRIRRGVTGLGKGFVKPYGDVYHGFKSRNYLKAIQSGRPISSSGEASMRKLVKSKFGMLPTNISKHIDKPGMTQRLELFAKHNPEQYKGLLLETTGGLGATLAFMGLGGAVNAGSALAQYNLGQSMGRRINPRSRSRLLGIN